MIEHGVLSGHLNVAAEILETRSEEILAVYKERLLAIDSPLLVDTETLEQLRAQARSIIERGRKQPT